MADSEVGGFVIKVGAEIDSDDLKKIREQLKSLQNEARQNATKLGLSTSSTSGTSPTDPNGGSYSSEIASILAMSQKTLLEIAATLKNQVTKVTKISDDEKSDRKKQREERKKIKLEKDKEKQDAKNNKGIAPFVQDVSKLSAPQLIGGGIGAGIGALAGRGIAGANSGAAIGSFLAQVFSIIKDAAKQNKIEVFGRISEDFHFAQLNYQTNQSVKSLHILDEKLKLTGESLQNLVDTSIGLSTELLTGLSPVKTQLLMALGGNPMDFVQKMMKNPIGATQDLIKQINKSVSNELPGARNAVAAGFGISPSLLFSGKNQSTAVNSEVDKIIKAMEDNGKVLLRTVPAIVAEYIRMETSERTLAAKERLSNTLEPNITAAFKFVEAQIAIQDVKNMTVMSVGELNIPGIFNKIGDSFKENIPTKAKVLMDFAGTILGSDSAPAKAGAPP